MSTIKTNQLVHTANGASVYTLPQTDGSAGQVLKTDGSGNLSWVSQPTIPTGGLEMVDMWYLSSSKTLGTSELAMSNSNAFNRASDTIVASGIIGTGMTMSGQYFSFPSTGIYEITFQGEVQTSSQRRYVQGDIYISTDGSNYTKRMDGITAFPTDSGNVFTQVMLKYLFDVTNISTHKLYFTVKAEGSCTLRGDADVLRTHAIFKKLGET
tara:strand:- start:272 stop:904 length:633 start_codon:yes stop_codon:yes gene_type:complete